MNALNNALLIRLRKGDAAEARKLIAQGADPMAYEAALGGGALEMAAISGSEECVDLILENAWIEPGDSCLEGALRFALANQNGSMASKFVRLGADPAGLEADILTNCPDLSFYKLLQSRGHLASAPKFARAGYEISEDSLYLNRSQARGTFDELLYYSCAFSHKPLAEWSLQGCLHLDNPMVHETAKVLACDAEQCRASGGDGELSQSIAASLVARGYRPHAHFAAQWNAAFAPLIESMREAEELRGMLQNKKSPAAAPGARPLRRSI